jgi:hypothetical protein
MPAPAKLEAVCGIPLIVLTGEGETAGNGSTTGSNYAIKQRRIERDNAKKARLLALVLHRYDSVLDALKGNQD